MALLPEMMTTGQVAATFAVGPAAVRRWFEDGRLKGIRLPSGQLRFKREDVEAFLNPPADRNTPTAAAS